MENSKIKPQAFLVQLVASVSVSYLTTLIGYVLAWPSYTIRILVNETTPLEEPMSSFQITLLGSLTNFGALLATPLCGIVIEKLGRRYAAMVFGLPFVLTWAIISITTSVNMVLFAMFFAGFGAAGQVVSSVYISEIVQDSIRGGLSTSMVAGYFAGVLISYALGGSLTYHQVVYMHLVLSVLFLIMMLFLKESPMFLVQKGRDEDAANSISFYRRIPPNSKEVLEEIRKIKRLLDPRIEKILQSEENAPESQSLNQKEDDLNDTNATNEVVEEISSWKFLLNSPSSKRALFASLFLMTMSIFMGAIVLQVYAELVLQTAVPTMSSNLCAIALALVFLVSSVISATLTDRYGRKPITTWSSIITGISCLLLGLQIQLQFAPAIVTVLLIFLYCFAFNIGAATTPFVFTAEAFLPEVKSLCNSLSLGCMWLMNFIVLMGFIPVVDAVGLGGTFYIFCCICVINAIYSHFLLPETKGLPVDEIQKLFYRKTGDERRYSKNQV